MEFSQGYALRSKDHRQPLRSPYPEPMSPYNDDDRDDGTLTEDSMGPDSTTSKSDSSGEDFDTTLNIYSPMEPEEFRNLTVDVGDTDSGLTYPPAASPEEPKRRKLPWTVTASSTETLLETPRETNVRFRMQPTVDVDSEEEGMFESPKSSKKRSRDTPVYLHLGSKKARLNSEPFSDLVAIYLTNEPSPQKPLIAYLALLSNSSTKISRAITPNDVAQSATFLHRNAPGDYHLVLDGEDEDVVNNFIAWLYCGKVVAAHSMMKQPSDAEVVPAEGLRQLFLFAWKYNIGDLMEGVLNAVVSIWKKQKQTHVGLILWYIFALEYNIEDFAKATLHQFLNSWEIGSALDAGTVNLLHDKLKSYGYDFDQDPAWKLVIDLCVLSEYNFTCTAADSCAWPWDLTKAPIKFVCDLLNRVGGSKTKQEQQLKLISEGKAGSCQFLQHEECDLSQSTMKALWENLTFLA